MSRKNCENWLRTLTRRIPFRSFQIELLSGDRIVISHPETVIRVGDIYWFRGPDSGQRLFEPEDVAQFILPPPNAPSK